MGTQQKDNAGYILYEGPSVLTGEPIVAILTGLVRPSRNRKTGSMAQTWILRQDRPPLEAIRDGSDAAICGDCPLRATVAGTAQGRRCYVNVGQAPSIVWKAYKAGSYTAVRHVPSSELGRRAARLGAYGDPAAVPVSVWARVTECAQSHTGYTHQWAHPNFDPRILDLCMASVDSETDVHALLCRFPEARYFRVRERGQAIGLREAQCPAAAEYQGTRRTCAECGLCSGGARPEARSISIERHGSGLAWARA